MAVALPLLVGAAGTAAAGATAATAATAGLFGTAGTFSLGTTLSTLGTIGSVISPLLSARSEAQSYKFQEAQLKLQSKTAEAQSLEKANEIKRRLVSDLAGINAGYAARGVSTSSGTPQQAAIEATRVANRNVDIALMGGKAEQSQYGIQARQYASAGRSAIRGGMFQTIGKIGEQF